jgi:hypothetical protein
MSTIVIATSGIECFDTVKPTFLTNLFFGFTPLANEFVEVRPRVCAVIDFEEDVDFSKLSEVSELEC